MRELKGHIINPTNDTLCLTAVDEKGAGNANHHYQVNIALWALYSLEGQLLFSGIKAIPITHAQ